MNLRKILLLLFLSAGIFLHAQVRFDRTTYDLGNCPEDTVRLPQCEFTFTNLSKRAVSIAEVKTSCGCLKASFDRRPVQPGKTGRLVLTFDPQGHPGNFLRKVTVYFSQQPPPCILQIKGNVRPASRPRRSIFPAPPLPHRNSPVLLR